MLNLLSLFDLVGKSPRRETYDFIPRSPLNHERFNHFLSSFIDAMNSTPTFMFEFS